MLAVNGSLSQGENGGSQVSQRKLRITHIALVDCRFSPPTLRTERGRVGHPILYVT